MTKKKNNVYFLFLALALAFILMPVLTQSVSAAKETKILRIELVDDQTGERVAGECGVQTDTGQSIHTKVRAGRQATVTVDKDAKFAEIDCFDNGESGTATVPLKESGVTHATVFV